MMLLVTNVEFSIGSIGSLVRALMNSLTSIQLCSTSCSIRVMHLGTYRQPRGMDTLPVTTSTY